MTPLSGEAFDHVGEIELALRIIGVEVVECWGEQVALEGIDAGTHFLDIKLFRGRVALLNDSHHPVIASSNDPSVSGGVSAQTGQERRGIVVGHMGGDQLVEGVSSEERSVTGDDHDDRVVGVVTRIEDAHPAGGGVAGAVLFVLMGEDHIGPLGGTGCDLAGYPIGLVANDHHGLSG